MFHSIKEFLDDWQKESASTAKVLSNLTDASLSQKVYSEGRTLGFLAWHIALSIPEMMTKIGLIFPGFDEHAPAPSSAERILSSYKNASSELTRQIPAWSDSKLADKDNMYGQMWTKEATLQTLIKHEIHHRGQMTVLMRQAGLKVPGVCGPAKEDWAAYGMPAQE